MRSPKSYSIQYDPKPNKPESWAWYVFEDGERVRGPYKTSAAAEMVMEGFIEGERELLAEIASNAPSTGDGFFLSSDYNYHWYIVPVKDRAAWYAWLETVRDDNEDSWKVPPFAIEVGSSPHNVTFQSFKLS